MYLLKKEIDDLYVYPYKAGGLVGPVAPLCHIIFHLYMKVKKALHLLV